MRLLENFRNEIDELSKHEKKLAEELQEIPEKVQQFTLNANQIGEILAEADKELENVLLTENAENFEAAERSLEVIEENRTRAAEKMEKLGQELGWRLNLSMKYFEYISPKISEYLIRWVSGNEN